MYVTFVRIMTLARDDTFPKANIVCHLCVCMCERECVCVTFVRMIAPARDDTSLMATCVCYLCVCARERERESVCCW